MLKVTLLLLALTVSQAGASVFAQNATIKANNVSLKDVFAALRQQTGYHFLYLEEDLKLAKPVSLRSINTPIETILDYCFHEQELTYKIRENRVLIERKVDPHGDKLKNAIELQREITGRVTDQAGMPLEGATVKVKGTTVVTKTNKEGNYRVTAEREDVLVFTIVGYELLELSINNSSTVNAIMQESVSNLNEVVVVGYGTMKRSDLTGSIATVDGKDIEKQAVTTLDQGLQGLASGVQVSQNSGVPGGGVSVRIRGISSLGNNDPLYVIDGFPTSRNALQNLNPNDVESIEVLKDASATAIYGTRATNGVVIVSTKRGAAGGTIINFDSYWGIQQRPNEYEMASAGAFADLAVQVGDAEGEVVLDEWRNPGSFPSINWQDEIFRKALQQSYNLSLTGGNDQTQSSLSFGYFNQNGIVKASNFKRYSIRANIDHRIGTKVKVGTSMAASLSQKIQLLNSETANEGSLKQIIELQPILTAGGTNGSVKLNGNYGYWPFSDAVPNTMDNPIARIETFDQDNKVNRIINTTFAEWKILPALTYKINLGIDYIQNNGFSFTPSYNRGRSSNTAAIYSQYQNVRTDYLIENTLTYEKQFGQAHDLTLLAGQSGQEWTYRWLSGNASDFVSNELRNLQDGIFRNAAGSQVTQSIASYFARVNYKLLDTYILTGTIRRDGSSNFGPNNKFGTFPSASLAWRVSEESFLSGAKWLHDFKIRGSWGQTGNQDINPFSYLVTWSAINNSYIFGNDPTVNLGIAPTGLSNPDLKWETSTQSDIGFDASLFDGRITLVADYYNRKSEDILLNIPLPSTSGTTSAFRNAGTIQNNGFEVTLGYQDVDGDFQWSVNANVTTVNNKVMSLGGGGAIFNASTLAIPAFGQFDNFTITKEGGEIGAFYGWKTDGIFQNQQEVANHAFQSGQTVAGDRRFIDIAGPLDENGNPTGPDGVINDLDRTIIGSPIPDAFMGINFEASYKNFDFSVFFNGSFGNDILNYSKNVLENIGFDKSVGFTNISTNYYQNRWHGEGTSNTMARATVDDFNQNGRVSDHFVEDGSFIRLKNIQIGYTLPQHITHNLRIKRARIYISGQNLLTFTGYSGLDPEIGSLGNEITTTGIDVGSYPLPKIILCGLNVTF
ncbi:TonB-dependent receptor [Olivibacter domesticus]|nr:TonB-dependent receptor [Olivibacter domesticus]